MTEPLMWMDELGIPLRACVRVHVRACQMKGRPSEGGGGDSFQWL